MLSIMHITDIMNSFHHYHRLSAAGWREDGKFQETITQTDIEALLKSLLVLRIGLKWVEF